MFWHDWSMKSRTEYFVTEEQCWLSSANQEPGQTGASASWSTWGRATRGWPTWSVRRVKMWWSTSLHNHMQLTLTGASTGTCAWRPQWAAGSGAGPATTRRRTTASHSCCQSSGDSTSIPSQVLTSPQHHCSTVYLMIFWYFLDWANSKVNFCQKLILPKTVLAGKYIMLHRKLAQNNGLIVVWN